MCTMRLRILGQYQQENLCTALTVIQALNHIGAVRFDLERLRVGLECVTGVDVPARATFLKFATGSADEGSILLADGAHNEVAAVSLATVIDETLVRECFIGRRLCLVMAGTRGKDDHPAVATENPKFRNPDARFLLF